MNITENQYQETDLGNIAPNPKGEYSDSEIYEYLDFVYYQGGSYLCLAELDNPITGISPEVNKTTEYWQIVALPGGLTPEFVSAHNNVVNLAEQVERSATEVRTAHQNVSSMTENVTQMQEQVRQYKESAEQSKESVDSSRQVVERSEQNINDTVTRFNSHVEEKVSEVDSAIGIAKTNAISSIVKQQEDSIQEVKGQTSTYIIEKQEEAESSINTVGETKKKEIEDTGTEKKNEVVEAIQNKGAETLASIPEDYTALQGEVDELKGDLVYKEDLFTHAMSNEYYVDFNEDSSVLEKFKNINLRIEYQYGKFDTNGYKHFTNFVYTKTPLEAGKYIFINNTGLQFCIVKFISDTVGERVYEWRTANISETTFDSRIYINFAKLDNSDFDENDIYNIKKNFKIVINKEVISLCDIERLQCNFNPKFKDYTFVSLLNYPHTFVSRVGVSQKDTTKLFQTNKYCYKFSSESTVYANNEFRLNLKTPLNLIGIQEFIMIAYIPAELYMDSISLIIEKDDNSSPWIRTNKKFSHGWNYIHFYTAEGNVSSWNTSNMIRVQCSYIDDDSIVDVYVSDIIAVKPQKAKLIFIEDHGYSTFYKDAYPRLKQLGVPVTWGINPGMLGTSAGATTKLTQDEIKEMSNDPYCEFSFHSWDTTPTKDMSADDINNDVQKCITYLKKNGILPEHFWRCAWVQNQAQNAMASQYILSCYASPSSNAGFTAYPFPNIYNIPRSRIHGTSDFSNMFNVLKKTHCTIVVYTHDLCKDGGIHITESEFSAFLNSVSSAISEGWLEPTTYNRLCVKYGDNEQIIIN